MKKKSKWDRFKKYLFKIITGGVKDPESFIKKKKQKERKEGRTGERREGGREEEQILCILTRGQVLRKLFAWGEQLFQHYSIFLD